MSSTIIPLLNALGRDTDVIFLVRFFYLVTAAALLLISYLPALGTRFLSYGARDNAPEPPEQPSARPQNSNTWVFGKELIGSALDILATLRVPHSYFKHFYVVSTLCSSYWMYQLYTEGVAYQEVTAFVKKRSSVMTVEQIWAVIVLMFLQGSRRLFECLRAERFRSSTSRMWIGHYAIGYAFYLVTSVAVWVEGVPNSEQRFDKLRDFAWIDYLTIRYCFSLALFIFASALQFSIHNYLAKMKTYAVPQHFAFGKLRLTAPHYTAECLIYASLALIGAPQGQPVNITIVCALVFVFVNLSITAYGTKQWMMQKFEELEVKERFVMVPGLW